MKRIRIIGNPDGSYVRLTPNFGFTFGRVHWCRNKGWGEH